MKTFRDVGTGLWRFFKAVTYSIDLEYMSPMGIQVRQRLSYSIAAHEFDPFLKRVVWS